MMKKTIAHTRIKKEMGMFESSPSPGISCSFSDDSLLKLSGIIMGAPGSPFEHGLFNVSIHIPERYPFEPPSVRFVTPIYHPNIDNTGRICLDTLKLPPQGSWKPHLNISTVLMMIRVLMTEPGAEDPLMTDIWHEYKYDYPTYAEKARQLTDKHARGNKSNTNGTTTDASHPKTQGDRDNETSSSLPNRIDVPVSKSKSESSCMKLSTIDGEHKHEDKDEEVEAKCKPTSTEGVRKRGNLGLKQSNPSKHCRLGEN